MRHEQTAAFAAEGIAKATRGLGVAALTAGPGVTNGLSAIAGAQANGSPICVLGGRAPEMRWGSGSLQEIDHLPFVSPLVKSAETVKEPGRIAAMTAAALDLARDGAERPDLPRLSRSTSSSREAEVEIPPLPAMAAAEPAEGVEEAAALLASGRAPGDHGRHRSLLGPWRGGAAGAGRGASASRSSSTASAAAACRPITTSPSAAPAGRR